MPEALLWKGFVILLTFSVTMPWHGAMKAFGLQPVAIAVLAGFLVMMFRGSARIFNQTDDDPRQLAQSVFVVWFIFAALLVFAPSPTIVQHGISFLVVFWTAAFTAFTIWDPSALKQFNWLGRNWTHGQLNAAGWEIARGLSLVVINESLIAYGTLTDWVVGYSVIPILLFYLMCGGILLTHPYDEDA